MSAWLLTAASLLAAVVMVVGGSPTPAAASTGVSATPQSSGVDPNGPCYWNLCLYSTPSDGSLTAFSLWDVGPTPYYISIFNATTGALLARCGTGMSCTTGPYQFPPLNWCYNYVAFIGGYGAYIPPAPVQRTSATVSLCNFLR
jgi:hypothetical protein